MGAAVSAMDAGEYGGAERPGEPEEHTESGVPTLPSEPGPAGLGVLSRLPTLYQQNKVSKALCILIILTLSLSLYNMFIMLLNVREQLYFIDTKMKGHFFVEV